MTVQDLAGTTAVVTGASRGFGRAISISLVGAGARVVAVSRNEEKLHELVDEAGPALTPEVADAASPSLAARLIAQYRPLTVVLNAGATPVMAPLQDQTWETFSLNWEVDVKQAFHFARAALAAPLAPGSVVVSVSSGAALRGSPLSGGYAGAKATVRFISAYAASQAERASLGIRFVSVLPQLTPATDLGSVGVEGYAAYEGLSAGSFIERLGGVLSAEQVAKSVLELATDGSLGAPAFILSAAGLRPIS